MVDKEVIDGWVSQLQFGWCEIFFEGKCKGDKVWRIDSVKNNMEDVSSFVLFVWVYVLNNVYIQIIGFVEL